MNREEGNLYEVTDVPANACIRAACPRVCVRKLAQIARALLHDAHMLGTNTAIRNTHVCAVTCPPRKTDSWHIQGGGGSSY